MCQHHFKVSKVYWSTPVVRDPRGDIHDLRADVYCRLCGHAETRNLGSAKVHWLGTVMFFNSLTPTEAAAKYRGQECDFEKVYVAKPKHGSHAHIFLCLRTLQVRLRWGR